MDSIKLGIPAEQTERIISVNHMQTTTHETENQETFISLPALFRLKDINAPHGLVLKSDSPVKKVLLTPRIENELEIPEDMIHPLPESLAEMLRYFSGAYVTDHNVILILNPDIL